MADEERLVDRYVLEADDPLTGLQLQNPIHQEERIALRQPRHDLRYVHRTGPACVHPHPPCSAIARASATCSRWPPRTAITAPCTSPPSSARSPSRSSSLCRAASLTNRGAFRNPLPPITSVLSNEAPRANPRSRIAAASLSYPHVRAGAIVSS